MRNPSFPTLRAIGSAVAEFTESFRGTRTLKQWTRIIPFLAVLLLSVGVSLAQSIPPDIAKKLDDLDKATKNAQMAGDNAWVLTSSAVDRKSTRLNSSHPS